MNTTPSCAPAAPFRIAVRALIVGLIGVAAGIFAAPVCAQPGGEAGVFYTCTDAAGNRLTSDRLIASCMDREQRMLSSQGILLKVVPPEQTAVQRAAQQAKDRQAAWALQRQRDQERLIQALTSRYPTPALHEAARRDALAQNLAALGDAKQQFAALQSDHDTLARQMQAYRNTPDKIPARLRHDVAGNASAIETQRQIVASLQAEVDRVNAQFDTENNLLRPIWQARAAASGGETSP